MLRSVLPPLCLLALAAAGCQPSPTTSPDSGDPPPPITTEDPIAGDPTDIEGEDIGEDVPDNAAIVDPGPAEAAVNEPGSLEQP